jgi:hypothetical protein
MLKSKTKYTASFSKHTDCYIILLLIAATWIFRIMDFDAYPYAKVISPDCTSNLFGANTFAQGRLSNPPGHWGWYLLDKPHRMMKYQPGMALFMAAGIKFFGHAAWGVVLCMSLAIGASYWALRGWVKRFYALAGALLLLVIFRAPHYWMYSYSGGGGILLGSMLMIGAYPRLLFKKQYKTIIPAVLGLIIALLTRPFEGGGLALSLGISAIITLWCWFKPEERIKFLKATLLPATLLMTAYLSFQFYYNYRVTDNPFLLPYMDYHQKFDVPPIFLFGTPNFENFKQNPMPNNFQYGELKGAFHKQNHQVVYMLSALAAIAHMDRPFFNPYRFFVLCVMAASQLPLLYFYNQFYKHPFKRYYLLPFIISTPVLLLIYFITSWGYPHYLAPYFTIVYTALFLAMGNRTVAVPEID